MFDDTPPDPQPNPSTAKAPARLVAGHPAWSGPQPGGDLAIADGPISAGANSRMTMVGNGSTDQLHVTLYLVQAASIGFVTVSMFATLAADPATALAAGTFGIACSLASLLRLHRATPREGLLTGIVPDSAALAEPLPSRRQARISKWQPGRDHPEMARPYT